MGEIILKTKYYFQILILLFSFILFGCQSSLPETITFEPSVEVPPPTQVDTITVVETTEPTVTLSPTPAFTPTPAISYVHHPATSLENQDLLVSNADGTFVYPTWDATWDAEYHFPVTPAYLWNIQHAPNTDIDNVVIEFDIHATASDEIPGYDRGVFVGLYNLSPLAQDNLHSDYDAVALDRDEILRGFLSQEDMLYADHQGTQLRDFVTITQGEDGVLHYRIVIPYAQFAGAKNSLAFQPLPGTVFTEPRVTVETNGDTPTDAILNTINEGYEAPDPDHNYDWAIEERIDHVVPGAIDPFIHMSERRTLPLVEESAIYMMPAVDYGLEDVAAGDYVLAPEGMLASLSANKFWNDINNTVYRGDENLIFMMNNMLDPETGLVHGVWDFSANGGQGALIETDRHYSNIALVSTFRYHELSGNTKNVLTLLLERAVASEIVEMPNGQLVIAPDGINSDGSINISLQDLAWGSDIGMMYGTLSQTNPEAADRLLEAHANTLQILLQAQEATPANLLPAEIMLNIASDGSYVFEYIGPADIGSPFYTVISNQYESIADWLNIHVHGGGLFSAEHLDWISSLPADQQAREWDKLIAKSAKFDNGHKVAFAIYKILYNTYLASDGNYTRYYSLTDGAPIYMPAADFGPNHSEVTNFQSHFGFSALVNWRMIAMFFHDIDMMKEPLCLLEWSGDMMQGHIAEDDRNALTLSQFGLTTNDAFLIQVSMVSGVNYSIGGNLAPWGNNSFLAWRESLPEALQRMYHKHGIEAPWADLSMTPTSANP